MALFQDVLATLPACDHLEALELRDANGELVARLANQPGTAGSVRVYHALFQTFGAIDAAAAARGIELYAEHSDDARAHPGKHPNIDRLFAIVAGAPALSVALIQRS
ncbi:hypothetical protein EV683_11640 [Crenobacter luteus]|uniref:RNA polymerase subunit sigma-32 n=1 Tax=Crenobacter luteus TaxID=1452487 RepID=A0A161SEL8_9NEIS|nr:DUF2322 family protein [Crenobacter luteus]KZE30039.1 hypothetical protein AVW16_12975 [Crenobacter luteus]TCP11011.1 hypothetical protein EV683_11640 [Crenobacter luteus]